MRWIFVLLLVLTGCQTAQEKAIAAARAQQAAFHQKCVTYGLTPGTEAYAHCRQQFDLAYGQEQAMKRAVILQHLIAR